MKSIWISLKQNDEDIQTIHITAFYKVIFLRTDYMGKNQEFYSIWDLDQFKILLESYLLNEDLEFNDLNLSFEENITKENFKINEKTTDNVSYPLPQSNGIYSGTV